MPDVEWPPPPFPQKILAGYRESRMDTRVLSPTDAGIVKQRQDVTEPPREFRATLKFPVDQKATWDSFMAAVKYGAVTFVWSDPDDESETPALRRFQFIDVPDAVDVGRNFQCTLNIRDIGEG